MKRFIALSGLYKLVLLTCAKNSILPRLTRSKLCLIILDNVITFLLQEDSSILESKLYVVEV